MVAQANPSPEEAMSKRIACPRIACATYWDLDFTFKNIDSLVVA